MLVIQDIRLLFLMSQCYQLQLPLNNTRRSKKFRNMTQIN